MYTRILVPLDGSQLAEQVLPYALLVGKALKSRIRLLQVFEPLSPDLARPSHGMYLDQVSEAFRAKAQDYLANVAEPMKKSGLVVSISVHEGSPAHYITEEAAAEPSTLVAMTTHGRSGVGRWLLGSVTDKVLHASNNPLLVIRPKEPASSPATAAITTIIAPLDGSALAEEGLPHVTTLSKALGAKVLLVRITPSASDYYRYMEYSVGPYRDFSVEIDAEATEYLHRVSQGLRLNSVASVEERLLHGNPAAAIIDLAKDIQDNLIAMTTHGRSGLGRWILGSVADRVVRHSGGPVLMIHPTGAASL